MLDEWIQQQNKIRETIAQARQLLTETRNVMEIDNILTDYEKRNTMKLVIPMKSLRDLARQHFDLVWTLNQIYNENASHKMLETEEQKQWRKAQELINTDHRVITDTTKDIPDRDSWAFIAEKTILRTRNDEKHNTPLLKTIRTMVHYAMMVVVSYAEHILRETQYRYDLYDPLGWAILLNQGFNLTDIVGEPATKALISARESTQAWNPSHDSETRMKQIVNNACQTLFTPLHEFWEKQKDPFTPQIYTYDIIINLDPLPDTDIVHKAGTAVTDTDPAQTMTAKAMLAIRKLRRMTTGTDEPSYYHGLLELEALIHGRAILTQALLSQDEQRMHRRASRMLHHERDQDSARKLPPEVAKNLATQAAHNQLPLCAQCAVELLGQSTNALV